MRKISIVIIAAVFCFLGAPTLSSAVSIEGDGPLGDFTGTFIYDVNDPNESTIEIELTNTSPMSNGGYLTAFAFNIPSGYITGISLESSDDDFGLLGDPDVYDDVKGVAYGYYDIGASVTDQFLGGGGPTPGIPVGATETFTFNLAGTNLDMLDEWDFLNEMSVNASPGQGAQLFLARFRGFDDGGSNKTPGRVVPIPGALWLLGCGLIGLAGFRRKF